MRFGLRLRLLAILIVMLLPACMPNSPQESITANGPISTLPPLTSQALATSGGQTALRINNSSPTGGETSATQLPASTETQETADIDWRTVPIMPEVSERVLQIYQDGQAQGRDPHSFSVIGDCQSIPYVFLGPFGRGELQPDSSESYLWDAINQFKGSFDRWSVTSRGGFTAASILNPIQADPHSCKTGETPLSCEYRLNNPAFAFITLETWLDLDTVDRYESYLRQILDYVIGHGTVPILMTKADSAEVLNGVYVINPAIVRVAHDYDVPVVNFWEAAQYLDNHGIDPNREGFHLSQEGYDLKNILALRALYTVWKAVESGTTVSSAGLTPSPVPTATPSPQPGPQVTVPDCSAGCVFFATAISQDGVVNFQGVYAYAYGSKKLTQVLGAGFDLQDVSEDGRQLLANNANRLYEINLADASSSLVSDSFYSLSKQGAYWNSNDSQIIFLDQDHPIQTDTGPAIDFFPSARDGELYFESGACASQDYCQTGGIYQQISGGSATLLDSKTKLVFSPDGKLVAYLNPAAATGENYYHIGYLLFEDADQGIASRRVLYFPEEHGFMIYPDVRDYAFSPQNDKLFILYDVYSAYFEKSLRLQSYLLDVNTGIRYDYGSLNGVSGSLNPRLVWSPQGDKVLFFLTDMTPDEQYSLNIFQSTLSTGEKLAPYDQGIMVNSDYFYITNIYWR